MIPTTERYDELIQDASITSKIEIEIYPQNASMFTVTNDELKQGSFSIDGKCVLKSELAFGSMYATRCTFGFESEGFDRYLLYEDGGAVIKPFYYLYDDENSVWLDPVPLGEFKCISAERAQVFIDVEAVDNMDKLDKKVGEHIVEIELAQLIVQGAEACDIELAHTLEELQVMINGTKQVRLIGHEDKTWREVLGDCASLMASFGFMNYEGKLQFKTFSQSPDTTISGDLRYPVTEFADYDVNYTHINAEFLGEDNLIVPDIEDEIEPPLPFDDNLLLRLLTEEERKDILENIVDHIKTLTYTPVEATVRYNPAIELGDMVAMPKGATTYNTLVTDYEFRYRGKSSVKSIGRNPILTRIKEKAQRALLDAELANINIDGLEEEIEEIREFSRTRTKNFYQDSEPAYDDFIDGDLWFDTSNDYKMHTYQDGDWVAFQLGENAIANLSITNAKIADGTITDAKIANLNAGKITAGTLDALNVNIINLNATNITSGNLVVGGNGHVGKIEVLDDDDEVITTIDKNGVDVDGFVKATGFQFQKFWQPVLFADADAGGSRVGSYFYNGNNYIDLFEVTRSVGPMGTGGLRTIVLSGQQTSIWAGSLGINLTNTQIDITNGTLKANQITITEDPLTPTNHIFTTGELTLAGLGQMRFLMGGGNAKQNLTGGAWTNLFTLAEADRPKKTYRQTVWVRDGRYAYIRVIHTTGAVDYFLSDNINSGVYLAFQMAWSVNGT